ncbi:MAG: DUF302 domain-containing protein [Bacteroidetes bacterium]|nr:DUF302 domain-containing protein [Bacteroidota bacterium]
MVTLASNYSVKATIDRLEHDLRARGVTIFGRIDQQAEAATAGLNMNPLELLIFGNPKAGTLLMEAEPLSGLDLPLKAMAWQDNGNKVWLTYNSFSYLQKRYGLSDELIRPVSGIEGLLKAIVQ